MIYYLYRTTNLINGKIYIGVHHTDNIDDGYMGSGKAIKNAIAYYGKENFKKDILESCEPVEHMYSREKEIVNEEFVSRSDTYNLMIGGWGGELSQESINKIKETMSKTFDGKGSKNTQYGTIWITDGSNNKKIKKIDIIPDGWYKGFIPPADCGDKVRNKLKGRTLIDILGKEKAEEVLKKRSLVRTGRHKK
jgi:hypothetical protein